MGIERHKLLCCCQLGIEDENEGRKKDKAIPRDGLVARDN